MGISFARLPQPKLLFWSMRWAFSEGTDQLWSRCITPKKDKGKNNCRMPQQVLGASPDPDPKISMHGEHISLWIPHTLEGCNPQRPSKGAKKLLYKASKKESLQGEGVTTPRTHPYVCLSSPPCVEAEDTNFSFQWQLYFTNNCCHSLISVAGRSLTFCWCSMR